MFPLICCIRCEFLNWSICYKTSFFLGSEFSQSSKTLITKNTYVLPSYISNKGSGFLHYELVSELYRLISKKETKITLHPRLTYENFKSLKYHYGINSIVQFSLWIEVIYFSKQKKKL